MSTWASRLSSAAKSASVSSSCAASPLSVRPAVTPASGGGGAAASTTASDAPSPDVREEFRRVAEKFNEESACMLRLPPDCWDVLTQYLSYIDVVALGQTCRSLWVVLHERESVWWRQLAYLHQDIRDLRGGTLLCTAPLFPRPPPAANASQSESLIPSPTTAPPPSTTMSVDGGRSPRGDWVPMSAYERFFQERRVYVLDARREWYFQELADVEDKVTGMFTVALHDGKIDASHSFTSLSVTPPPALLPRTTASAANTPVQAAIDAAPDASLSVPPSSLSPQRGLHGSSLGPAAPTLVQTPGTSAGSSPVLAPSSPAPPTPPLLPRVGDPIINDHNPLLQLRIYTIDVLGAKGEEEEEQEADGEGEATDDEYDSAAVATGRHTSRSHGSPTFTTDAPENLAGMSEDEVLAYVMQLSLQEAQAAAAAASPAPARTTPAAPSPQSPSYEMSACLAKTAATTTDPLCWPHNHYRGAPGSVSLPLSELLIIVDSINNNALDQLRHHQVRDCTADEEPRFLRRLAETLRSAKHRRLHLGNHHRAVRNNGQTTRNRAGRNIATLDSPAFNVSFTFGASGASSPSAQSQSQPQPPPPMNRMLRGFHGDLLEITEREARMVASKLLGKPSIIDDFVVFHCHDPGMLYRRLCPASTSASASPSVDASREVAETASTAARLEASHVRASDAKQVMKHGILVTLSAPLSIDPATPTRNAATDNAISASFSPPPGSPSFPSVTLRTVMRAPALKALPFFTRFFLAPELCHDGYIALLVVDVVRVLVVVDKEVVSTDNPDWASPLIDRGGRVVVPGQGYNPQAYTRSEYNYVPTNPVRRRRDSN